MSLAALVAGSPLVTAQRDPRPLGDHRRVPGFAEMSSIFDFEPVFHGNLPQTVYDYTAHGADSELAIRRNRDAFDWVDVVPRAPIAPATVDTRTTVLGLSLDFSLFVAPTALQVALHPEGEVAMHQAATTTKTPFIIRNNSSQPAELFRLVSGGERAAFERITFRPRMMVKGVMTARAARRRDAHHRRRGSSSSGAARRRHPSRQRCDEGAGLRRARSARGSAGDVGPGVPYFPASLVCAASTDSNMASVRSSSFT